MPLRRRARLQRGFGVVPGRLEVLDPGLRRREVAFVDQGRRIDDDGAESGEVAKLGCCSRLGRATIRTDG